MRRETNPVICTTSAMSSRSKVALTCGYNAE